MITEMSACEQRGQWNSYCPKPGQATGTAVPGVDRWELLACLGTIRKLFGLNDSDLRVIEVHLSVLPKGPLIPGRDYLSFMSGAEVSNRARGMAEHTRRRAEKKIAALGLWSKIDSSNKRRFPIRDGQGNITGGYGIDLTPLVLQAEKIFTLRDAFLEEEAEKKSLVTALRVRMVDVEAGLGTAVLDAELLDLISGIRTKLRRVTLKADDVRALDAELTCALRKLEAAAPSMAGRPQENEPEAVSPIAACGDQGAELNVEEVSCPEGTSEPQNTFLASSLPSSLERMPLPNKTSVDDGQNVGRKESDPKESKYPAGGNDRLSALSIERLWHRVGHLSQFFPDAPSSLPELQEIIFDFSRFFGLTDHSLSKAVSVFGWGCIVIALDYMAEKITSIAKPEAYLLSMVRAYERGEPVAAGRLCPKAIARRTAVPIVGS